MFLTLGLMEISHKFIFCYYAIIHTISIRLCTCHSGYYGFRAYTHEKDSHLLPEIETSINSFVNGKKKPKDVNIACIVGYVPEMVNKFRLYIAIPNRAKDVRDANLNKNRNFNAYRKRVHKVCEATGK